MPWLDAMDCRRGSCLGGAGRCVSPRLGLMKRSNRGLCPRWSMRHRLLPLLVAVGGQRKAPQCEAESGGGLVEIDIDGVTVRIGRGADASMIGTVLRALKAGA